MNRNPAEIHSPISPIEALRGLHPSYFALVMATGIVSIAAHLTGYRWIAWSLLAINIVTYPALVALYVARAVLFTKEMREDFAHHGRGVGFFTSIAGTCVLGSQFVIIAEYPILGMALWIAGIILWASLTYGILAILTVRSKKPSLTEGINGGWLVAVVAAQSVSILGSQLSGHFDSASSSVLFFCMVMWLGGGMMYIWLISLIFYRYTFFEMKPEDLAPPYWINMGAVAISTLAGTFLLDAGEHNALIARLSSFILGVTLLFWATATWWIPMLFILGIWRHVIRRFPLRYDPLYWGAVFPLGMYTVCTYRLADAVDASFLHFVPHAFIFVAFGGWLLTFLGLILTIIRLPLQRARSRK